MNARERERLRLIAAHLTMAAREATGAQARHAELPRAWCYRAARTLRRLADPSDGRQVSAPD